MPSPTMSAMSPTTPIGMPPGSKRISRESLFSSSPWRSLIGGSVAEPTLPSLAVLRPFHSTTCRGGQRVPHGDESQPQSGKENHHQRDPAGDRALFHPGFGGIVYGGG